jgi:hypothetical protein
MGEVPLYTTGTLRAELRKHSEVSETLDPASLPSTLNPAPYTLHRIPYTLQLTAPYTLHPKPDRGTSLKSPL